MGAVQSSIGAITVVLPSLFTIALVTIATSFGTLAVSFVFIAISSSCLFHAPEYQ